MCTADGERRYTLSTLKLIRRFAVVISMASFAAADTIVLRDGTTVSGTLKSCDDEQCLTGGRRIPLTEIARIELTDRPAIPSSVRAGAVVLTDGSVRSGAFTGLNIGYVWLGDDEIERSSVAAIVLADRAATALPSTPMPELAERPPQPDSSSSRPQTALPSAAPTPPPAATDVVLNEVLFLPDAQQAAFVELRNTTSESLPLAGFSLQNGKGKRVDLPATAVLPPLGLLLIVFDSDARQQPGVVHVGQPQFLGGEAGSVWLRSKDGIADAIAWDLPQPFSVSLCRGGRCAPPRPGSVIARIPGNSSPGDAGAWAPLDPAEATPGAANPRPPVSAIAGIDGIVYPGKANISWYSVPAAASYRVQIAREKTFADVIADAVIESQQTRGVHQVYFQSGDLPRGDYFWRVQAVGPAGEAAKFSRAVAFSVDVAALPPMTSNAGGVVRKELDVPVFRHEKDTRMLLLEPWSETNPAWDTPHRFGYPYCVRAGAAMLNAFYGGKLSQDRIGFEAYKDLRSGPEYDLPIIGITDDRTSRFVLPLAVGTSGTYRVNLHRAEVEDGGFDRRACTRYYDTTPGLAADALCPPQIAYGWGAQAVRDIRAEIDAGRPVAATTPSHLLLIVGYVEDGDVFSLFLQDGGGRELARVNAPTLMAYLDSYWIGLAPVKVGNDEADIATDGDRDGVVDFDETRRFNTNPAEKDSDKDGVEDKQEIRASVFDREDGYLRGITRLGGGMTDANIQQVASGADLAGRDTDRDGKMMELDPDSDDGGCKDGEEDADGNGRRDAGETSNFKRPDDPRRGGDGGCGVWYGKVIARAVIAEDWVWDFTTQVRLRETFRGPIRDATGERVGTSVILQCAGTEFQVVLSGECSAAYAGTSDSNDEGAGLMHFKTKDVDLTPYVGLDPPRDGGWHTWICSMASPPVTISCPHGSLTAELPLATWLIGRAPDMPHETGDPQARRLIDGRMTGSYRWQREDEERAVSWSVCPAGTPCAEPAPLP